MLHYAITYSFSSQPATCGQPLILRFLVKSLTFGRWESIYIKRWIYPWSSC